MSEPTGRKTLVPRRDALQQRCCPLPCCRRGAGGPTCRCSSCCEVEGTQPRLGMARWKMLRKSRQMQAGCTQKVAEEGLHAEVVEGMQGLLCWSALLQLERLKIPSQPKRQKRTRHWGWVLSPATTQEHTFFTASDFSWVLNELMGSL